MEEKQLRDAILFGLVSRTSELAEGERSLNELQRLLDTAGGSVLARVLQVKDSPDKYALYLKCPQTSSGCYVRSHRPHLCSRNRCN